MVTGSSIIALTPFMYMFASQAWHLYVIQACFGLGAALAIPPWYAIFTRHIDKMRENVEWSFESVGIGISGAGAAALSGIIVTHYGFQWAFFIGGVIAICGAIMQIRIYRDLRAFVGRGQVQALPDKQG